MVGDSFTFGYGVNDDHTVPALLERRFHESGSPDIRVLNLGMNGRNTVQASRVISTRAITHNPKIIVYEMTAEMASRTTGRVAAMCRGRGVPTLDLLDPYVSRPDRAMLWTLHGPPHFNIRGNRLVADEIYRYLTTPDNL